MSKSLPKLLQFILWAPGMSFKSIHPKVGNILQSEPKWWTDRPIDRPTLPSKEPRHVPRHLVAWLKLRANISEEHQDLTPVSRESKSKGLLSELIQGKSVVDTIFFQNI